MKYLKTRQTITRKIRRNSGRVTPNSTLKCKKKFIIDNCIEPTEFYDDWVDYRDSYRDLSDKTLLKKYPNNAGYWREIEINKENKKLKLLLKRRKARRREWE